MKARGLYLVWVIWMLTLVSACCSRVCPANIVTEVFKCLHNLTMLSGAQFLVAGADLSHVKQKCTDGSFRSTSKCIRSLLHRCSGRQRNVVKKLVDLKAMEQSFIRFCNRIDEYEQASGCIQAYNPKISRCIEQEMHSFDTAHVATRSVDDTVVLVCKFLRSMTVCIDEPVRNFCSAHSANLLLHFMVGFTPPACAYSNYRYFHSGTTSLYYLDIQHAHLLTLLSVVVTNEWLRL